MTDSFFALLSGRVPGCDYTLSVHELGDVVVPSGRLEASDPFVMLGEGLVTLVPPGRYPVLVTVADVSDAQDGGHLREAYLSLVVADGETATVERAVPEGADPAELEEDEFYGVPVDAGTVAFADADAVAAFMPEGDWYEDVFDDGTEDSWFSRMDDPTHLREGAANIVLPRATGGENVVLAHSGWGDGVYPLVRTRGADGELLAVHIDLQVAGGDDGNDDAAEDA